MKERIEKYIKKKQREKAIKMLKDNIPVILGVLGLIILLVILKILKNKAKIRKTIKREIGNIKVSASADSLCKRAYPTTNL